MLAFAENSGIVSTELPQEGAGGNQMAANVEIGPTPPGPKENPRPSDMLVFDLPGSAGSARITCVHAGQLAGTICAMCGRRLTHPDD